ncbi:MAG: hypothetical protein IK096_01855 [Lachnospiraceae bacterium]|nr:hypothetical protein [Lachnospiraceae bacterium]
MKHGPEGRPMNRVWEILRKADTIAVFDVDGTLFSYNYGTFHAHHDLDDPENEETFRKIDMYADAKGLPVIRDYIREHGTDHIYCLSMEPHGHEAQKSAALNRYYGIAPDHCLYVNHSDQKAAELQKLIERLDAVGRAVYIDDNESVLRQIEQQTTVFTAHVTIFFT